MNLNFIGKEFDRLAKIEDYINYEYEPKSNKKFGKRNIYYEDIKLDFINEVNTYGFSPFILENYVEQRDDPNIMRFMTKKFNHGLTNYIKIQTRGLVPHTSQDIKKYILKKKKPLFKKKPKKKEEIYSNIYLIKKNEDTKKDEVKENFLQKALIGGGGYKLNLSMDDDDNKDEDKDKENQKLINANAKVRRNSVRDTKDFISKEKTLLDKKQEEKNIELLKEYIGINSGKFVYDKIDSNKFPNLFNNNNNEVNKNKNTLKLLFQNNGLLSTKTDNKNSNKVLSLSKNKEFLGDKRDYIFKQIFSKSVKKPTTMKNMHRPVTTTGKITENSNKRDSKTSYNKTLSNKKKLKDEFLLLAKARPYRYMTSVGNE